MHEVLVNRLGGLSLPRKSVVRLTDVYRGRKTSMQYNCYNYRSCSICAGIMIFVRLFQDGVSMSSTCEADDNRFSIAITYIKTNLTLFKSRV